jgi:hypothetical protein
MASKNSRGSRAGSTNGKAVSFSDQSLIIPLGAGHAYIFNTETKKNLHARANSPQFVAAVREGVAAGYGPKLRAELDKLADTSSTWKGVVARLDEEEVFAPVPA